MYKVPQPQEHDRATVCFIGGHVQPHLLVTPAMVTSRININQVEVLLTTPVLLSYGLSYGNGPHSELDTASRGINSRENKFRTRIGFF